MDSIERAREIFDYVYGASLETVNAARGKDVAKNQCLLFLIRAMNAARAARVLFEQGFELEAKGVNRVIIEGFIEFSFIRCEPAKQAERMKLFHEHAVYGRYKEAAAIAELNGTTATNPYLPKLEAAWKAVKANYPKKKRSSWCRTHPSLWDRAMETGRALDAANRTPVPGAPTYTETFKRHYNLAFAEACMAAHLGAASFYELPDDLIAPSAPTSGKTLQWIAVMLAMLADEVADAVGHHPEHIFNRAVDMVKASEGTGQ
jgi:hypothetical protein